MQDFMNVNKTSINNAVDLSMFMTNVSAKLMENYRCQIPDYSVIDIKSHYRGLKYTIETLKILPQKPEDIVIEQIIGHLSSNGAIHNTRQSKSRIIGEGIDTYQLIKTNSSLQESFFCREQVRIDINLVWFFWQYSRQCPNT